MSETMNYCILYGSTPIEVDLQGLSSSPYVQLRLSHDDTGRFCPMKVVKNMKVLATLPEMKMSLEDVEKVIKFLNDDELNGCKEKDDYDYFAKNKSYKAVERFRSFSRLQKLVLFHLTFYLMLERKLKHCFSYGDLIEFANVFPGQIMKWCPEPGKVGAVGVAMQGYNVSKIDANIACFQPWITASGYFLLHVEDLKFNAKFRLVGSRFKRGLTFYNHSDDDSWYVMFRRIGNYCVMREMPTKDCIYCHSIWFNDHPEGRSTNESDNKDTNCHDDLITWKTKEGVEENFDMRTKLCSQCYKCHHKDSNSGHYCKKIHDLSFNAHSKTFGGMPCIGQFSSKEETCDICHTKKE